MGKMTKIRSVQYLILIMITLFGFAGCGGELNTDKPYFNLDVTGDADTYGKSAFENTCAGCHGWSADATWDATDDIDGTSDGITANASTCDRVSADTTSTDNMVCQFKFSAPAIDPVPQYLIDNALTDGLITPTPKAGWSATVERMQTDHTAYMTEGDKAKIITYLDTKFNLDYVKPSAKECVSNTVTYTTDIAPLINATSCFCHGGDFAKDYVSLITKITSCDPENSLLYKKLEGTTAGTQMPVVGDKFTTEQLQTVYDWIAGGAQE